ncbi:MAG TPA: aldo/keto reductase [Chitinophagaceae bacterium]|nr:aldo/keto reductase [Chitinophagaceae bacterium]
MNNSTNKTFKLGNDITVNRMGYGAMRLTGKGIWGQPEDKDEAIMVLQALPGLGVNFIDTADSYGPYVSEELIAEALYPYPPGLVIATKGGYERPGPGEWQINSHPDHLQKALEGSLKRLKLDRIDLYQLHRVDPTVPFKSTMTFLQSAQQQGLIKHVGLSEVDVDTLKKAQEYVPIVSLQNRYSIFAREWEVELEYCSKHNIAFIPWNPINAGNVHPVPNLGEIARRHKATIQQTALSWLYHHAPNILLIPGTSKLNHAIENTQSADILLSAKEMNELSSIATTRINQVQ